MTAAASQVTTQPPGRRTRKESAPTREKRHFRETAGDPGNRCSVPGKARQAGARGSRTARQSGDAYGRAIGRTILCSGAIVLYKIPKVVIGENRTFQGEERWLASHGVAIEVLQDEECIGLMREFMTRHPQLWAEDIGE